MSETLNSSVRKYNSANESQQKLSGGCDYYRVTVNSGHRITGSNVSDALYRISGVFPNNNAHLLNGSWEVFLEHFFLGVNETTHDNQGIRVCLPDLVNVGKDFATQIGSKIQPTSRIATVHDSQHSIVGATADPQYIVSDTPHVYNIRPIGRESVGHSITPQQLFQQDLRIELRKDTGEYITTGDATIVDGTADANPVDYHATLLFVHRY